MKVFTNNYNIHPTERIAMFVFFFKIKGPYTGDNDFYHNDTRNAYIDYCQEHNIDFIQLTKIDGLNTLNILSVTDNNMRNLRLLIEQYLKKYVYPKYEYIFNFMGDLLLKKTLLSPNQFLTKDYDFIIPQQNKALLGCDFKDLTSKNIIEYQYPMHVASNQLLSIKNLSNFNKQKYPLMNECIKFYRNFKFPYTWMASPYLMNQKLFNTLSYTQIKEYWQGNDFYYYLYKYYENRKIWKVNFYEGYNVYQFNNIVLGLINSGIRQENKIISKIIQSDFINVLNLDNFNFFHFIDCGRGHYNLRYLVLNLIKILRKQYKKYIW